MPRLMIIITKNVIKFLIIFALFSFIFLQPNFVFSADLFLSPSSKSVNVGDSFFITLFVNSSDQSINAVSARINFDPNYLKIISLSKVGSKINLWVQEPSFDNNLGEVFLEGIILNPGFIGNNGKIISLNFKALKEGKTEIKFLSGSVLANDGEGTNVLKNTNSVIVNINKAEFITPEVEPTPSLPVRKNEVAIKVEDPKILTYENKEYVGEWLINPNIKLTCPPDTIGSFSINDVFIENFQNQKQIVLDSPQTKIIIRCQKGNQFSRKEFLVLYDKNPPIIDLEPKQKVFLYSDGNIKIFAKDEESGLKKITLIVNPQIAEKQNFLANIFNKIFSSKTDEFKNFELNGEKEFYNVLDLKSLKPGDNNISLISEDLAGNKNNLNYSFNLVPDNVVEFSKYLNFYSLLLIIVLLLILIILVLFILREIRYVFQKYHLQRKIGIIDDLYALMQEIAKDIQLLENKEYLSLEEQKKLQSLKKKLELIDKEIEKIV